MGRCGIVEVSPRMEPASVRTKVPSFLSDLGKATLRGIRKCPRCGTYNGTRGLSCKNKTCGTVFRYGTRKQPSIDAVKLITGSNLQVYSVRQRDRGPDYRCFVELGVSETAIQTVDGTIITQLSSGRCYVPSCLKAATQGVVENQCQHIKLALNCQTEATPLTLKSSVLNSMQASPETKQTIWQLATEPTGPLVQRITKNVLVVKCKASQKHSLGYLHASFAHKISTKTLAEHRFSCSCQALKPGKEGPAEETPPLRCIHFFACICAFASDESLAQEFADFLTYDSSGLKGLTVPQLVSGPESTVQAREVAAAKPKKRKKDVTPGVQAPSPLLAQDSAHSSPHRSSLKKPAVTSSLKRQGCNQLLDESQVTLSFQDWLASVTERIHQTMHYQFEAPSPALLLFMPTQANRSRWCSTSLRLSLTHCSRGFPAGAQRRGCPTPLLLLSARMPFPWAPSPSTRGTSPTFCRSSRSLIHRSCRWRSRAASSRTGTGVTSFSGAPRWRWRASLRHTGTLRSNRPSGPSSSRPSSKWAIRPQRRRSRRHSSLSGSPTSCHTPVLASCASSSSTATMAPTSLALVPVLSPGPLLPHNSPWSCPPLLP
ncbi:uncharacterized protein C2orf42 homolog isoform X3 [Cuculus canorus]|uniref:uncharacterized protein C2orf42 homolog isoform X3 n=1 Tax=Cuculus canorus TaxID=55661 RepID=UPI0023AB4458|nr:uncharacterized protein C2orf42 homolog isoform X3 [Cuculus canorus]